MTILEDLKSGRLVVVPREATAEMQWADAGTSEPHRPAWNSAMWRAFLAASPDHTAGLIALVEGMERERDEAEQALRTVQNAAKTIEHLRQNARFDHALRAEVESIRQHGSEMTDALLAAEARALAAEAERDEAREEADTLKALICQIEPHIDAIVCYASTIGEHEPNRIAREVRSVCHGPSQDELAGRQIAERMISKIDAAATKPSVERGWLIELKGSVPSWAAVNPKDYDEHWTTDSTKALRFARREDAQSYIDHIGWTEAFPSEHIWDDGDRHDQ
jgi:hypothetical protein